MSINLSSQSEQLIAEFLREGRFASAEEAIEAALANFRIATREEFKFSNLCELVEEGIADMKAGRFMDGDEFFEQLEREEHEAERRNIA